MIFSDSLGLYDPINYSMFIRGKFYWIKGDLNTFSLDYPINYLMSIIQSLTRPASTLVSQVFFRITIVTSSDNDELPEYCMIADMISSTMSFGFL